MNYFKAAEQVLSSVPTLERALENLKHRKQQLIDSGKPRELGTIDYRKPFTDTHYVSDTLNELLAVSECERDIANTNEELAEIRRVIEQLSDEYKKLVTLWYIEKRPKEAVKSDMGLCVRCGKPSEIVHHKIHLTPQNIDNPSITLSEDNLETLCRECHAIEHEGEPPTASGLVFDSEGNLVERAALHER